MRIGILTYHYVYNEGALWQAHCLCKALRRRFPKYIVEVVDYRYKPKSDYFEETYPHNKKNKNNRLVEEILGEKIPDMNVTDTIIYLNSKYDALVVGSDIIWQFDFDISLIREIHREYRRSRLQIDKASLYTALRSIKNFYLNIYLRAKSNLQVVIPIPNIYWLGPEFTGLKISYAASSGYSNPNIPDEKTKQLKHQIESFDLISVRDKNTLNIVRRLDLDLANQTTLMPDPAWMSDDPLPDVTELLQSSGVDLCKPVAGVLYPRGSKYKSLFDDVVLAKLRKEGFQVISVIDSNPLTDVDVAAAARTFFEWWAIIEQLNFLVTVRTHPTIAALLYKTPFVNFDTTAIEKSSLDSKSVDMLAGFGLEQFCLYKEQDLTKTKIETVLHDSLSFEWDWEKVNNEILHKRKVADSFIDQIEVLINNDRVA